MNRLAALREKVEGLYEAKNPGRADWADWLYAHHVMLVADEADKLARRYGADAELAAAAGMLHDIADAVMKRDDPHHENESMRIARDLLIDSGFTADEIAIVVDDAIKLHSCRNGMPYTIEGKVMASGDAFVHLTSDFYQFYADRMRAVISHAEVKEIALKKIERDFTQKICFDDLREEARIGYEKSKSLFGGSQTTPTIKAIVFDVGGVIELYAGGRFIDVMPELLGVTVDEFKDVYFKYNHFSNVHNAPWEETVLKVVAEFDDREETQEKAKELLRTLVAKTVFNADLIKLFPLFRKQGLKIGILSNATSEMRKKLEGYGIPELVDEIAVSGEIGFQKPHKEAFEIVFERLGVHAHEAIFIDDSPKSLEKAAEIGYTPLLYKDNEQLKSDLKRLSIAVE